MTTFTVPYGDDSDSGSSSLDPEDPCPTSSRPPDSPTRFPKALCVAKGRKSLPKEARYRQKGSRLSSQDQKGRHVSKTGDKLCGVNEKVEADMADLDLSDSTRETENDSKPNNDGRTLSERINAPWSDDDDDDYMVMPADDRSYGPKTPSSRNAVSSSPTPSSADIASNASSPSLNPSLASPTEAQRSTSGNLHVSRTESYMDICSPNDVFFEDQDSDEKSKNQSLSASQGRTRFPSHLRRGSGQAARGNENEECLIIDDALLNLFNCWDLLDYQQYLWRIEGGLTSETRRNNTMIMEERTVKQVSFDYYRQSNPFRDVPETERFIIIHRLPLPSPDQRFYGDAYLLGCDASSKLLFARRFVHGCPNDHTELPLVWENGMEVFRISVDHLLLILTNSLVGDDVIRLPRLVGSQYCLVVGYMEWLGMEVIILIRFAQWVLDFAESLFQEDEDEIMDMLATIERAADQLRLVVRRGTSDAWRAYDNGLNRMEYSQKILANNENVTSLYTLSNKGCFSREFLAGSVPRPKRGSDKDREWLGRYGRHQSTEQGIERVGKRMAGLSIDHQHHHYNPTPLRYCLPLCLARTLPRCQPVDRPHCLVLARAQSHSPKAFDLWRTAVLQDHLHDKLSSRLAQHLQLH